jgi:glycine hydroxymethyltransferase
MTQHDDYSDLEIVDKQIYQIINAELKRQNDYIELIASENFTSKAVMQAQGSILTNKYAEGYPGKRYYEGCHEIDKIESLAIERAKTLFNCSYANVQPHSGSQANQAVFLALLQPHDVILSMSMDSGGHLTHGAAPNLSGKWFKPIHYSVNKKDYLIDYDQIEELALRHRPKLIIAGYSCYSRTLDFAKFRTIADRVGAYLLADIAHIAGLVITGNHPHPFPHAHIITSTTHKTLRGPRGGLILANDHDLGKKLNLALFPGLQGGPLMHVIAAKAVSFLEASSPNYHNYIKQVLSNAKALANSLQERNYDVLTGGTDNHIVIVDLRKHNISGKKAAESLDRAGLTCNKNSIPFDITSPMITSGIRLGTPAGTSRGFLENEFIQIGQMIAKLLDKLASDEDTSAMERVIYEQVLSITKQFPLYI